VNHLKKIGTEEKDGQWYGQLERDGCGTVIQPPSFSIIWFLRVSNGYL